MPIFNRFILVYSTLKSRQGDHYTQEKGFEKLVSTSNDKSLREFLKNTPKLGNIRISKVYEKKRENSEYRLLQLYLIDLDAEQLVGEVGVEDESVVVGDVAALGVLLDDAGLAAGERLEGPPELAVLDVRRRLDLLERHAVRLVEQEQHQRLEQRDLQLFVALCDTSGFFVKLISLLNFWLVNVNYYSFSFPLKRIFCC